MAETSMGANPISEHPTAEAGGRGVAALLVVDAANVVGSVPNGWWRDRAGATARLRDALIPVAAAGLADGPAEFAGEVEVVLVVEGAARGVEGVPGVTVVAAPGSGDDAIVRLVRDAVTRRVVGVVTADRGLRERVGQLGALVIGPRALPHLRGVSRPGDAGPPRRGGPG